MHDRKSSQTETRPREKPPAFQFYVKEWMSSTKGMPLDVKGAYMDLLAWAWDNGPVPDDAMWRRTFWGVTPSVSLRIWSMLRTKWVPTDHGGLVNPRLEQQRASLQDFITQQSERGKAGAEARWGKRRHDDGNGGSNGGGMPQALLADGSAVFGLQSASAEGEEHVPADALRDAWNDLTTPPLPRCLELSDGRRRKASARLSERSLSEWQVIIRRIERSSFCRGLTGGTWVASFDWLLRPDTAAKVLEGQYDDRPAAGAAVSRERRAEALVDPIVRTLCETAGLTRFQVDSWFAGASLDADAATGVTTLVLAPDPEQIGRRGWVTLHYGQALEAAVTAQGGSRLVITEAVPA